MPTRPFGGGLDFRCVAEEVSLSLFASRYVGMVSKGEYPFYRSGALLGSAMYYGLRSCRYVFIPG